jgi:hypothetical protein
MPEEVKVPKTMGDSEHLEALGYTDSFHRSMTLWGNFALGFTYLSPLVGVYSFFALALSSTVESTRGRGACGAAATRGWRRGSTSGR